MTIGSTIINASINIKSSTNSVSSTNGGALTVVGGAGIGGDLIVGGTFTVNQTINGSNLYVDNGNFLYVNITSTTDSVDLNSGSVVIGGGITIQTSTNALSSTNGGALTIAGGCAIARDLYVGGVGYMNINALNSTINNLLGTNVQLTNITTNNLIATSISASNMLFTNLTTGILTANTINSSIINSANDISFFTNTTQQMIIMTNGNVGIGTTTPSSKLDINGTLRASLSNAYTNNVVNFNNTTKELTYRPYTYGSFISNSVQALSATTANLVTLNSTGGSTSGLTLDTNKVTFSNNGVYKIGVSILFIKSTGGHDTVTFWFKKNGSHINNSSSHIFITGNGTEFLGYAEIIEQMSANDYIEVYTYTPSSNVSIQYTNSTGDYPAAPGIIMTIYQLN